MFEKSSKHKFRVFEDSRKLDTRSIINDLWDLTLRLSLLNLRLFKVTSTTRSRTLITKNARDFSKTIVTFILANKKNNAKNYLYVKISINLRYRINYYLAISIKVFQLVELAILTKKQEKNLITIILKSIVYIAYWRKLEFLLKINRIFNN